MRYEKEDEYKKPFGARMSIGIGQIDNLVDSSSITIMQGEAFRLSGRLLDTFKHEDRLKCKSSWDEYTNSVLDVCAQSVGAFLNALTKNQISTCFQKLINNKQLVISEKLNLTPQQVSQFLKYANYKQIMNLNKLFKETVLLKTNPKKETEEENQTVDSSCNS
jgi:hypothetical protein